MRLIARPPTLGCRLGLARESIPLTVAELSAATNGAVSTATIIALESGEQSDLMVGQLIALAEALSVWPHELSELIEPYYL
jgi:transcriptional regulator with XRE-family HTH domain